MNLKNLAVKTFFMSSLLSTVGLAQDKEFKGKAGICLGRILIVNSFIDLKCEGKTSRGRAFNLPEENSCDDFKGFPSVKIIFEGDICMMDANARETKKIEILLEAKGHKTLPFNRKGVRS